MFLAGGKAAAAVFSVEEGQKIVQVALEKFGGVHILIANAGILRDKSFQAMTEQEWDAVLAVHLRYARIPLIESSKLNTCCLQWYLQGCQRRLATFPEAKVWTNRDHRLASWHLYVDSIPWFLLRIPDEINFQTATSVKPMWVPKS
jgi:NAD(P)-dependent dehydrogenase (short-subunit alcohol dehydrogenase family)